MTEIYLDEYPDLAIVLKANAGLSIPDAKCLACNDFGWLLMPLEDALKYPPKTPISQKQFKRAKARSCQCQAGVANEAANI